MNSPKIIIPKNFRKVKKNEMILPTDFDLTMYGWKPTRYANLLNDSDMIMIREVDEE